MKTSNRPATHTRVKAAKNTRYKNPQFVAQREKICCVTSCKFDDKRILVPRAHDRSGLWQGSRALAGPDFLSMCRAFISYSRPIRFDGKSVNRRTSGVRPSQSSRSLPQARRIVGSGDENGTFPKVAIIDADQKERGLWWQECFVSQLKDIFLCMCNSFPTQDTSGTRAE